MLKRGDTVRHRKGFWSGRGKVKAAYRNRLAVVIWTEERDASGLTDEEATATHHVENLVGEETEV